MSVVRFCVGGLILSAICIICLPSLSLAEGKACTVKGRVMYMGAPVGGAAIYAYKEPDRLFVKPSEGPPTTSYDDGSFAIELPKGNYYIAALKKAVEGELYSFYGGNPVSADPARAAEITLNLVVRPKATEAVDSGTEKGGIEGVVTSDGEPLAGAVLYVYLDTKDMFRGMGYYMSPPTGVDGAYRMKMSEGTYYILARKRIAGGVAGPLHEGDYFGYLDINPVVVHNGKIVKADIPMVKKVEKNSPGGLGRTSVKGVVKDASGKPAAGLYACVYKGKDMLNRPAFISKPTGPDGVFEVEIPIGGVYYLGARSAIGGPVDPGQLWGRYNGSVDHSVTVETGKTVDGVEITVEVAE